MIVNLSNRPTRDIFEGDNSRIAHKLHRQARRKLDMLNAAGAIDDLKIPPSNRLEKLHGDRKHQHSIRINDQYRVVFSWVNGDVEDVEIVDYH